MSFPFYAKAQVELTTGEFVYETISDEIDANTELSAFLMIDQHVADIVAELAPEYSAPVAHVSIARLSWR